MIVVIVLACAVVLGAVVVLAAGRGGELAPPQPDHARLPYPEDYPVTGAEVAATRLPRSMFGYHPAATEQALDRYAAALTERDARLESLQGQVTELRTRLKEDDQPYALDD
ncbi:hypothetical protein BTM25_35270 [Actinomadura rubteroloni]|uniref:DivIVA domain-containing protein n=1 Tax=Actinomadura rubteroloni TaxID=1926885 RepID=A0A2P4UIK1_9ACTN|nr:DivIVA domain protein [Actinomadura rubteroloni]POM24889.1 hypothetical protein BTM25_35270 [Actinomadura rubteroloni]